MAEYWERGPLHVQRDAPGYFADLYDVADIEDSLVAGARDLERFALVRAGSEQAPLGDYVVTSPAIRWRSTGKPPTAHVDARKVAGLLDRGYTLVIKDAALLSARLQRSCNRLGRDLGAFVGANVYFTPAGAQGLDRHHDTHDTLTIQIEGRKTWRVYEPLIELPLESQPLHRGINMPELRLEREVTLSAGETLYLPRGYAHEAVATTGRALHVTFALAPLRAIDLLHATSTSRRKRRRAAAFVAGRMADRSRLCRRVRRRVRSALRRARRAARRRGNVGGSQRTVCVIAQRCERGLRPPPCRHRAPSGVGAAGQRRHAVSVSAPRRRGRRAVARQQARPLGSVLARARTLAGRSGSLR